MSSPTSPPFSLFPSRSSSPQQSYTCAYPPCPARFTHPSDLDFHQATHHSTMGYSPISALNRYPDLAFPTPPTSIPASLLQRPTTTTNANANDSFPFPAASAQVHEPLRTTTTSARPPPPPLPTLETRGISSSSSSSSSASSSFSTTSSTTTTSPTLRHIKSLANFSLPFTTHPHASSPTSNPSPSPSTTVRRGKGGKGGKAQKRNTTACVMRCGRHGDEWLGLRGWRLWR
ncbi:hypothetical protein Q9189_001803 [Teloschistes chrysophthalmus]